MPGLEINLIQTRSMMSDKVMKVIFLTFILIVGDPFVTLKAQSVPPIKVSHITPKI